MLRFESSEPLTLGVEVEIQLLDEDTLDLKPASPRLLEMYHGDPERVKAELFQSMLEINTRICGNAHEIRADLETTMDALHPLYRELGLRVASSGTHPFALYNERIIYPALRYKDLIDRNQWIARRLMIFGLHVHVGMRDGEHAIQMNNALLHYLPLLLGLSASSPFCHGEDTELASSRITFFEALPTGGHPCLVRSWAEFQTIYSRLLKSDAVRSPKDIWWDIRPSPGFGTLEIRICDGPPTLDETVALTALIHSLCIMIDEQLTLGRRFGSPPDWIMRENKWRASRHGVEARLIIDEEGETRSFRPVLESLLDELAPILHRQSYFKEADLLRDILQKGPSYKRQRVVAVKEGQDLKKVTASLVDEFEARTPIWSGGETHRLSS